MECPRCGVALEAVVEQGVEVDRCCGCGGEWLDQGEGEALSRPELALAERVEALDPRQPVDDSPPLACPRCRGTLQRERYATSGVEIDRCDCGVWLDRGEREKIAAYRARCLESLRQQGNASQGPGDFLFAPEELERSFARIHFRLGRSE
ncbi:MAG: hypothetical protein D6731_07435 [Planctomycetota bacterium]|nr:MAG: hypothetical protein D6731_07435 [Planctomycetota bacterium]